MEAEARRFYETAVHHVSDASTRKLLGYLALEERNHTTKAEQLEEDLITPHVREEEDRAERRLFVLQIVQPGLAGLMDGSVSTLAPVFAAAFATRSSWDAFLVEWLLPSVRVYRWALPKRCQTMVRLRAADTHGLGDLFAV